MTLDETVDLLTVAAAYDLRKLGESDSIAWHAAIGDLGFRDARAAVVAHYQETTERIMPAHVRLRVKEVRRIRLEDTEIPPPPAELLDNPVAYRAALRAATTAIADGRDPRAAMQVIVRQVVRPELEAS
jgi:hypothetical protein